MLCVAILTAYDTDKIMLMVVFVRMVKTHELKRDPKITQAKNII
jgi:hypothetical protein